VSALLLTSSTPALAAVKKAKARAPIARNNARQARLLPTKKPPAAAPIRRDTTTAPREVADPNDPREQRIAKLRDRLVAVLQDRPLSRTKVGIEVMQASNGDVLFAHNAAVQFNPASNTKMLTTAAAMSYLGPDFRYHTALYGPPADADGVVHGDVVLRGSGDPSLATSDVAEIARALSAHGVKRIEGDLYADPHFHARGHSPDDAGGGEGALILNRNTYGVRVRPGETGHSAVVSVEPRVDLFGIENQATTVHGKRSRLRIDSYRKDDRLIITVRGRIADNRGEYVDLRRLADGSLLAASVLRAAFGDFGVELTGRVRGGNVAATSLLAEHISTPLSEVCRLSNKPSNNFIAEAIYKTLGGELYGAPGTLAKGTHAVMDYLTSVGIKPGAVKIVNGSGLTHENRITPQALSSLLRKIYYDMSVAPEFMSSLAVAGIDGTIRNRFMGTDAVGLVRRPGRSMECRRCPATSVTRTTCSSSRSSSKVSVIGAPTKCAMPRCAWSRRCCRTCAATSPRRMRASATTRSPVLPTTPKPTAIPRPARNFIAAPFRRSPFRRGLARA
jgi:D-alanyl-D-alanine carboxypeptidase/D-alanyl-D-alanine-endopeptidase (penicillin-binding protein 4)